MTQTSRDIRFFVALDSWRGICAIIVVLYHFKRYGHLDLVPFIHNGWFFVDFFFVLSGFIISQTYRNRLTDLEAIIRFIIRRFGRLYPLHVFVLVALLAYEFLRYILINHGGFHSGIGPFQSPERGVDSFVANLFLVNAMGLFEKGSWNTPSWSIGAEFYTYIVFAMLVPLHNRIRILILFILVFYIWGAELIIEKSPNLMNATYDLGFVRCVMGFGIGMIVSLLRENQKWSFSEYSQRQRSIIEVIIVIAVLFFVSYVGKSPLSVLAPILFGFAVFVFSFEFGGVSKMLSAASFRFAGKLSYSIYMIHVPVIILFDLVIIRVFGLSLSGNIAGDIAGILLLVSVMTLSYITYNAIEVLYREKFKKISNKW